MMSEFLTGKRRVRFQAIQQVLVPRSQSFSDEQQATSVDIVNGVLSAQAPENLRKLGVFLLVIDGLSLLRSLRTFKNAPRGAQTSIMQWLYDNPVSLLRKGFWGLNTLCKMGVYGQESLYREINYVVREDVTNAD